MSSGIYIYIVYQIVPGRVGGGSFYHIKPIGHQLKDSECLFRACAAWGTQEPAARVAPVYYPCETPFDKERYGCPLCRRYSHDTTRH